MVGTAPGADPNIFPLDTPVLIPGDRTLAAQLGKMGTLPWVMEAIFDQTDPLIVMVRVQDAEAATDDSTETATETDGNTEAGGACR